MSIEIKISKSNKSPPVIIGDGKLTPCNIAHWEHHVKVFFLNARTPDNKKVALILNCFSGLDLLNWVDMNRDKFLAKGFSFESFIKAMCSCFLDPNWEMETLCDKVYVKMPDNVSFATWSASVIAGNMLIGLIHKLAILELRKHLHCNICRWLNGKLGALKKADHEALEAIEDFDEWRKEIISIDDAHQKDLDMAKEMVLQNLMQERPDLANHVLKCERPEFDHLPACPAPAFQNSHTYNTSSSAYNNSAPAYSNPVTGSNAVPYTNNHNNGQYMSCPIHGAYLGKLTKSEIHILGEHDGCQKCHRPYVTCHSDNCEHSTPDSATYTELTVQDAVKARDEFFCTGKSFCHCIPPASTHLNHTVPAPTNHNVPPSHHNEMSGGNTNAGIFLLNSTQAPSQPAPSPLAPSSTFIADSPDEATSTSHVVCAVLPSTSSTSSFVLGNRLDMSMENASEADVSPVPVPHLVWRANACSKDINSLCLNVLIDTRSTFDLISLVLAEQLMLPFKILAKPFMACLALKNETAQTFQFEHYVTFSLSSHDDAWTSKHVSALIAHGLCNDVLLGLPFLSNNNVTIDCNARTTINGLSGYDLLNRCFGKCRNTRYDPKFIPKMIPPIEKRRCIAKNCKVMLDKLLLHTKSRQFALDKLDSIGTGYDAKAPANCISAIKSTIEGLAAKELLQDLDRKLKDEFRPVFSLIPHISELPDSKTAHIHLKDQYKKISK